VKAGIYALFLSFAACAAASALDLVRVGSGFSGPLFAASSGGSANELFVVEKGGAIKILNTSTGITNATPFLTIPGVNTDGEGGLLGLAFHPDYATNGKFYVDLINAAGDTEVREYTVSSNPAVADPNSGRLILSIDQPTGLTNHKAGWIGFSPTDGNLYIAAGDGGSGNDPSNNGQNTNVLLGKMLRIDINTSGVGPAYTIPEDNPFASGGGAPEIWAYGLRNPFRNSFDRLTGDFYIADVGQGAREEVNFQAADSEGGENYGWRLREGTIPTPGVGGNLPGATDPIYDYTRGSGPFQGETVIGGYVYRGGLIPELEGTYFFGDFIDSKIWSFKNINGTVTELTDWTADLQPSIGSLSNPSAFGEGADGELYIVSNNGDVFKIVHVVPEPTTWILLSLGVGVWLLGAVARSKHR
jgi:glucose/arabinose dehydrogenase